MPNNREGTISTQAKILFVDDEPRILRSLKATFKSKYIVLTAENAASAQVILTKESPIDVIVADERMPDIAGHQLLLWSRDNFPACTRILLSSVANKSMFSDEIGENIFDFVRKPWDPNHFEEVLSKGVQACKDAAHKETTRKDTASHAPSPTINNAHEKSYETLVTTKPPSNKVSSPKNLAHCGLAMIGCAIADRAIYKSMLTKIDCLSRVSFSNNTKEFIDTVIGSPDIGIVCIDVSIGYSETKQLLDVFQKQKRKYQILLTTDPARAKRLLLIKGYVSEEHFIIKPASLRHIQSKISASVNKYIQENSHYLKNRKQT